MLSTDHNSERRCGVNRSKLLNSGRKQASQQASTHATTRQHPMAATTHPFENFRGGINVAHPLPRPGQEQPRVSVLRVQCQSLHKGVCNYAGCVPQKRKGV